MEIAALGLRVDGVDNVGKASQNLDDLTRSAKSAEGSLDSLSSDATKATKNIKEVGDQSDRTSGRFSALGGAAKAAGGVIVAAFSVAKVAQYADAWSDMQSRVGAATGSMDTAGESMNRLLKIANASYSPLAQTSEIYSRNVSTFKDLGRSAADAADFTESLNNMLVLTATRGERAASVQNALSKALAVGKLQAEGLETVLANGGEVAQALATKLGTTVSGLRDMASQGKITGDVIASSIVGSLDDVRARAEEMPATLGDAFVRIGNNVTAFVGQMDQATGATGALAAVIVDLADAALKVGTKAIDGLVTAMIAVSAVIMGRVVSAGYASAASFAAAQVQAVRYQATLAAMAGVSTSAAVGITTLSVAARAASGAMALLGGPVGAVTIAASAILYFATSASKAEREADELDARIQKLGGSFSSLNAAQAAAAILDYQEKLDSASLAVSAAENTVESLTNTIRSINDEGAVARWERELVIAKGAVGDANDVVAGLKDKIAQLTAIVDQNTASQNANNAAVAGIGSAAESYIKSINERTAAIIDGNDPIKQANRHIKEHGQYSEEEASAILKAAQANKTAMAARNAATSATKAGSAAVKAHKSDIQELTDRLFPAQAAQAKYNAELAILKKHLSGDQLARAVSKLTKEFTGGDADGAAKAIKEYNKNLKTLVDRLNPAAAAARTFKDEQKLLLDAIKRTGDPTGELARSLEELERQYRETSRTTNEWTKWTESALDRVDGAFANAWRNIGDGFKGFRDNLTNAFKQMLAELAHMAITRPIVMQIGAAMGIGGGGAVSGIGGMLSSAGGGSGGISWGQLASYGQSAYSALTGVGPAALAGWQSGGLWGGAQAVGGYYGNMLGNAASTVGGWLGMGGGTAASGTGYQLGGSLVSGGIGNASYATGGGAMAGNAVSAAPWLSGIGGAFMGYQNAGLKGAAAGGLGGFGGAKIGASLGANLGPVGAAVGAIAGGILGALGGSKLFGGKWQTKAAGLALSVDDGEFYGRSYEYQKKKGGLFSSNKKRTRFRDLDADTESVLSDAFTSTADYVSAMFETLGYSVNDALANFDMKRALLNTKGKSEEQINKLVEDWFGGVADSMTSHMQLLFGTGLDYDFEQMSAFVDNLLGVNEMLRYLDVEMYTADIAGGKLAERLSELAGGLDVLATNAATYYDNFFSAEEKITDTIDSITRTFEAANIPLADSREAYRAMVEDIDMTTEAGQQMFATMMGLAGQAAQYFDILDARLDASLGALQRAIAAQQKRVQDAHFARIGSLNDMAATASASISALTSISNSLGAAVKRLRGTSDDATRSLRAQAVMTLNSALVSARSGRSLAGFDGLQDALDIASQMDTKLYSSLVDFEREQGRTANLIAELEKVNGKQLSAEERLLKAVQDQISAAERQFESEMARLDMQLAYAQSQVDALKGVDNSIMDVGSAVAAMNASVVAAVNGLSRELSRVSSQANTSVNNSSIPGFSSGGIASGPISGYPVELHGTEAVIPLNGSSIPLNVPGIKALVHEVSELRKELAASQRAIAEHTSKSARVLEREEMERRQEEVA